MTAWEELLAKSTAPLGSTAWEHLISQAPGGGPQDGFTAFTGPGLVRFIGHAPSIDDGSGTGSGPGTGINSVVIPAGEATFTGHAPTIEITGFDAFPATVAIVCNSFAPNVVIDGPATVEPATGNIAIGTPVYSRTLSVERAFKVDDNEKRFVKIAAEKRVFKVQRTTRVFKVPKHKRYVKIPPPGE